MSLSLSIACLYVLSPDSLNQSDSQNQTVFADRHKNGNFPGWGVYLTMYVNVCANYSVEVKNYNGARNFVGPVVNFLTFNNGYHTIHHMHPTMHWSRLAGVHVCAYIHVCVYLCTRIYVYFIHAHIWYISYICIPSYTRTGIEIIVLLCIDWIIRHTIHMLTIWPWKRSFSVEHSGNFWDANISDTYLFVPALLPIFFYLFLYESVVARFRFKFC